jgi:hypothetical protein
VTPKDVLDQQIVRAPVHALIRRLDRLSNADDYRLVRFEQATNHDRGFLGAVWRPWNAGEFGCVARVSDGETAQALHPLGE